MSESDIVLGVDPGLGGGLAWVTRAGHLIAAIDMPVFSIIINAKTRRKISATGLVEAMQRRPVAFIIVETVVSMPRKGPDGKVISAGATSAATAARGAGMLEGIAAALEIPFMEVMPHIWKRRAEVPRDKGGARLMAQRLWPGAARQFSLAKSDGKAEAALLARWAALS